MYSTSELLYIQLYTSESTQHSDGLLHLIVTHPAQKHNSNTTTSAQAAFFARLDWNILPQSPGKVDNSALSDAVTAVRSCWCFRLTSKTIEYVHM